MNEARPRYARHLVIVTIVAFCTHVLFAHAGFSPASSAVGTALTMLGLLALVTGLTPAAASIDDEPGHVSATRLLAMAGAAAASSVGAAHASGHVALLIIGFLVGIPYVVYALRKEVDDHISLPFLLFASVVQVGVIFWIVS